MPIKKMPIEKNDICTILVITYNHENYISKALDSILSQKTKYRYKIHIFDDCSSDRTKEVIRKYEKQYSQIKCEIAEQNQGAQSNIWRAFESVDTKYFILLEGDDYWCDNRKLELQIEALEKHPECSFCGHNTYLISLDETSREYTEGAVCCTQEFLKYKTILEYKDFVPVTNGGYIPYVSARLIRTEAIQLEQIRYKESVLFDFTQFYYLLLQGKYYYIDKPMSVYQRTGNGVCSGRTPMEFLNVFVQNAIDFNKQTNNIIADKIYSECILQIKFRLSLYTENYIKKAINIPESTKIRKKVRNIRKNRKAFLADGNVKTDSIVLKENQFSCDTYYYLCNGGLGHTVILCGLKKALEEKWGKICFLLQKEHEFIAKLYQIEDYILVNLDGVNTEILSDRYPYPEKGKIFVTHPFSHREAKKFYEPLYRLTSTEKYIPWLCEFLGIEKNSSVCYPNCLPELSQKSREKVHKLGDLNQIVLFLPEALTVPEISERVWEKKAKKWTQKGYRVISCPQNREQTVKGSKFFDLSAEEIVYIGMKCHAVYSIRNGFCELLYSIGKRLHILYPSHSTHFIYSLREIGKDGPIQEEIVLQLSNRQGKPASNQAIPKLFGMIRIPGTVYTCYHRHRHWFPNQRWIRLLVKWK